VIIEPLEGDKPAVNHGYIYLAFVLCPALQSAGMVGMMLKCFIVELMGFLVVMKIIPNP